MKDPKPNKDEKNKAQTQEPSVELDLDTDELTDDDYLEACDLTREEIREIEEEEERAREEGTYNPGP